LEKIPLVTLEKLQEAIPEYDWSEGHSGALLPKEIAMEMDELWSEE
jgi:hypothetical protein